MAQIPETMVVACPDCGKDWPVLEIESSIARRHGPPYGVTVSLQARTDTAWVAQYMTTHKECRAS